MGQENLDPQKFIDSYGLDALVQPGKGPEITLGQALKFEEMFCDAEEEVRKDPVKRIGYLAKILAATGTLRPEDEHLLGKPE